MELMIMDSPMGYCCLITRSKLHSIPTSAAQVRSKLLPLISALISNKGKLVIFRIIAKKNVRLIDRTSLSNEDCQARAALQKENQELESSNEALDKQLNNPLHMNASQLD
jgi:hypothetical protein